MTLSPKEKAKELVHSYLTASFGIIEEYVPVPYVLAKQCALIAVDEILKVYPLDKYDNLTSELTPEDVGLHLFEEYWQQVKNEIQLL
jgi:hypothetical protein